ncbi:antibiotic biosynthesis monooxygenase family protein [Methanoculleus bourgensis]|uniref:antibiotic biosynthesis monooxygenase family protein n=1 Tax=Methanoculleus bourgensis TaxID=83986 RepID=UPI0024901108|nr:antibiotic biosynthesis monooxygenase family protein [Methanoculleus bourgensis]
MVCLTGARCYGGRRAGLHYRHLAGEPGRGEEFIAAWKEFAEWTSRLGGGSLEVLLLQDAEQPQRFVSVGPWKDVPDIRAWRNTPEFGAFMQRAKELCTGIHPAIMKPVVRIGERS